MGSGLRLTFEKYFFNFINPLSQLFVLHIQFYHFIYNTADTAESNVDLTPSSQSTASPFIFGHF